MGEAEQGTRDHGLGECPIVIPSAARDLLFRMGSRGRSLPRIKSGVGMTTQSTEGTLFRIPNPESRIPSLEVVAHVRPGASEEVALDVIQTRRDRKSPRLNSSHY